VIFTDIFQFIYVHRGSIFSQTVVAIGVRQIGATRAPSTPDSIALVVVKVGLHNLIDRPIIIKSLKVWLSSCSLYIVAGCQLHMAKCRNAYYSCNLGLLADGLLTVWKHKIHTCLNHAMLDKKLDHRSGIREHGFKNLRDIVH
jgi:hypothetical protein